MTSYDAESPAADPPRILKEEASTRVELVGGAHGLFVRKTYDNGRSLRRWRTFLCRSRAAREFNNLQALAQAGVDVVAALNFGETRVLEFVQGSTLETEFFASQTLGMTMAAEGIDLGKRRGLLFAAGRMLRQIHEAGFLSTTFYPRNLLVGDADGSLRLCDQPSLIRFRRPIVGSRRADVDLYDLAFTTGRRRRMSSTDRLRLVLAYTNGSRECCRKIWSRLEIRQRWRHRALKGGIKGLSNFGLCGSS